MPSRLKKGFFERAGDRQERLIRRYEEHMAKAARCGDCGKLREAAPDLWAFDDINDPDWYARELAEEEADRERRRAAGEEVSDDEDVVCPGCEAEKRGEKGVPHVGDDFNVPPNKPEEKAANRFDFDKMEENLRPELKEPLELLMRDLQIIREQQKLIREDEEKEIEEEQKDWPEEKRAAWRAELQEYRDRHMAIAFGDDTEGREPIVHPETGETIHVADLDGIGQFLKKMYSEEVPEPFRWPKYM